MGVLLTPIVIKETPDLETLRSRRLAVDAHGELYQFLALIRQPDGTPLRTRTGLITSHLVGLFYRTTRLMADYGLELAFVFDGPPPALKRAEIDRRRATRERFQKAAEEARAAGDTARAYATSTMSSRLTGEMAAEARELVRLLGLPVINAPGEGEAQAAHMAQRGDVWAAASKDYDALLFGAPRLLRFLGVSGREFLPSSGKFRPIVPELIALDTWLSQLGLSREQLVDLAILVGTDFNDGIKGIGPKKALALVRQHGAIEQMAAEIRDQIPDLDAIRQIYLAPAVTDAYNVARSPRDEDGIRRFLCDEREFSVARVTAALDRVRQHQPTLLE
jgi:flap endonuclease-1